MNRMKFVKKLSAITLAISLSMSLSYGQLDLDILEGGLDDGAEFLEAYIAPWANAFGASMNGGWYNTAKPHKLGGFDVTLTFTTSFVPSNAKTFDLNELDFNNWSVSGPVTETPTIAGKNKEGPTLEYIYTDPTYGDITIASINSPAGTGVGVIPLPMVKVGLGLPLGTEVSARFIPKIDIKDYSISMWGIGGKHSIMQYFPREKLMPIDLSFQGGYTKIAVSVPVEVQPDDYSNLTTYTAGDFENQEVNLDVTGYTINLLISKKLPIVTFYGGAGYSSTSFKVDVVGNYALPTFNPLISTTGPVYVDSSVYPGPKIEIENHSGIRYNAGIRLTLGIVTIHGDYTKANYSVITAGLGISFR